MARRKRKTRGAPDATRLARLGIDAADPRTALAKLAPTWGAEPDLEAWVVDQAGRLDDDGVGSSLHALEERTTDKAVRREIKRALYRLEQHGHWKAPEGPPPPSARDLLGQGDEPALGWLSAIDPTGTRLVWMARRTGGGMTSLSAVIGEEHGIREFHSGKTTRRALREAHKEIAERGGIPLVEAPWQWTYELVRRAHELTERGRFPEVPRVLQALVPHPPATPPSPPVDALLDRVATEADEAALAESADLLREPEIGTWVLPLPWLEAALEKLENVRSSVLIVSPAAQEERLREAMEESTDLLLDPEDRRTRFADRLEESAFLLHARGARARARSALAAAGAARAGRRISDIPVLAEITRRSLALAMQARAAEQAEQEKTALVVTPQQAAAERERARRRR